MLKTFAFLICTLMVLTQVGCSKAKSMTSTQSSNESNPLPVNEDLVLMDLKLETESPEKLTPEQNNLIGKVNAGETVRRQASKNYIKHFKI